MSSSALAVLVVFGFVMCGIGLYVNAHRAEDVSKRTPWKPKAIRPRFRVLDEDLRVSQAGKPTTRPLSRKRVQFSR